MQKLTNVEEFQTVREKWGEKLLILGHYYIPDETIALTDRQGDSLALSQFAAADETCEAIIFCGVHFMAETADILANSPEKIAKRGGKRIPVILPDMTSGCPMADMANMAEVNECWKRLGELIDTEDLLPVTYVNSTAEVKAFCGQHGGVVCTSGNARRVLDWALTQRSRILFLPDQHLGRNTALEMGIPREEIVMWRKADGAPAEAVRNAKIILWEGCCPVHDRMDAQKAAELKMEDPDAKLIVHPECEQDLVCQSESAGSTAFIIKEIQNARLGERFIIGTESHLVERLKKDYPELSIRHLGEPHPCEDMAKNLPEALFHALEQLEDGQFEDGTLANQVSVPEEIASDARTALANMLKLG
ncbi:MAG: quinolinate synthase NadA [Planctomycetaceae bacterium]|nr:quinolinate synthase NadA [Planctomycetaceae bacterium]